MDFEWDPAKARADESRHGVSFFEACEVFDDDHSSTVRDPDHALNEDGYLIFEVSKRGRYLVVSYTERGERNRLIPARQTILRERKAYEQR